MTTLKNRSNGIGIMKASVQLRAEYMHVACAVYACRCFLNMARVACMLCCPTHFNPFVDANKMVEKLREVQR